MRRVYGLILAVCCFFPVTDSRAQMQAPRLPFSEADLPDDLKPWVKWVMSDYTPNRCPFLYHTQTYRNCVWPSQLSLELTQQGGEFSFVATLFEEGWLALPGSQERWPQRVKSGGQALVVNEREGRPHVFLSPGNYVISGHFEWAELPENIALPAQTGLLDIRVEGKPVVFPVTDSNGMLWVKRIDKDVTESEHADVRVFRHISDGVPTLLHTRLRLNIAGKPREIVLGKTLMDGFAPTALESPLPARIEPDGTLRLQVRPGSWDITLSARHTSSVTELPLPEAATPAGVIPLPPEEVWVFSAMNHLRLVQIEGVPPIDPAQTELPEEWRNLPAYYVKQGGVLKFLEKKRGNSDPVPDELHVSREWWLDFDGNGYTVRDHMSGNISQSWRLEVLPEMELGHAAINGRDQFITRLSHENALAGIEVRPGTLNLEADSRMEETRGTLPAVGWAHDVRSLSGVLHLPPGWNLLHASGADSISNSWLQRWTLLDVFMLVIVLVVIQRLHGLPFAALAAPGFLLLHHELRPLTSLSLTILGCAALLRVLTEGRFKMFITNMRRVLLFVLLMTALPFMVTHMRLAFFPQLEGGVSAMPGKSSGNASFRKDARTRMKADMNDAANSPKEAAVAGEAESILSSEYALSAPPPSAPVAQDQLGGSALQSQEIYQYDPAMQSNTGFGVANWEGERIQLSWNGPVLNSQVLQLWLVSPTINLGLAVLRVLLLCYILLVLLGIRPAPSNLRELPKMAIRAFAVLMAAWIALGAPESASADDFPAQPLLDEMKRKLVAGIERPAPCLPSCASIPRASLEAVNGELTVVLEIHASDAVMVSLPGPLQSWRPANVSRVDAAGTPPLYASSDGYLYAHVERGVHQLRMQGVLPVGQDTVNINFPTRPATLSAKAVGWEVHGIQADGTHSGSVQLAYAGSRQELQTTTLEKNKFPALVNVERVLSFGLSWQMQTTVRRLSSSTESLTLEVGLIEGENLTTGGIAVNNGRAVVTLPAGSNERSWVSQIEPKPTLSLKAPTATEWPEHVYGNEIWHLNISNLWHIGFTGIPPVKIPAPTHLNYTNAGQQVDMPAFMPLPGETLTITASKPSAVQGQTITIDHTHLSTTAGSRSLDAILDIALRASQGGQHAITLPAGAKLSGATVNGTPTNLSVKDNQVTLPLLPASQHFQLTWNQPVDMSAWFSMPAVDMGLGSVNAESTLKFPHDRWILFTVGPQMGPAVLFWGWLPIVCLAAFALSQLPYTPLRLSHWLLLLLGLTQTSLSTNVVIVGWLLALGWRGQRAEEPSAIAFNLRQIVLALWTLVSLSALFSGIRTGLLGSPYMRIEGNMSSTYFLHWYQDISAALLPQPAVFSLPIYCYRALMLIWALWLAFALVRWLQWGWKCFSSGGYWKRTPRTPWKRAQTAAPAENTPES